MFGRRTLRYLKPAHWRRSAFATLLFVVSFAQAEAQDGVREPKIVPGSVSGRVVLEDTGGPARFASVVLVPVLLPKPDKTVAAGDKNEAPQRSSRVVHTLLDGSFAITDVAPGNYYVLADASGYVSGAGTLTREEMDHPTEKVKAQMSRLLVPVSVASAKISQADVTLHRGAALSGTVRFDDGTPFAGANISLYRRNERGEWKNVNTHLLSPIGFVDDTGHFRLAGLSEGAYRVAVSLDVNNVVMQGEIDHPNGWSMHSMYTLNIFYPDATREKDAHTINLKPGEEDSSLQIEVPLSKLHAIRGSLVLKGTGHPVNSGHVSLLFSDDQKNLASTEVSSDDGTFELPFVPEGSYLIKVSDAKEVSRTEIQNPPNMVPPTHTETKVLQTFGTASQALVVTTDAQGIVVGVPLSGDSQTGPVTPAQTAAGTP